jgi:predicted transcriptional regulator
MTRGAGCWVSARVPEATRRFQLLHQIALLAQDELLEATLDLARFQSPEARGIAKIGLANYFAGASQMPYVAFLTAAQEVRGMIWSGWPTGLVPASSRWRTGCPRCNGRG